MNIISLIHNRNIEYNIIIIIINIFFLFSMCANRIRVTEISIQ